MVIIVPITMDIIVHITDRHLLYLKMYIDRVSINIKNTIKHTFKVVNFFLFNLENHLQYIQHMGDMSSWNILIIFHLK